MCKEDVIPYDAVAKWENLGIELGMDPGFLSVIDENHARWKVEKSCKDMLKSWWNQQKVTIAAKIDLLIKAIEKSGDRSYAQELEGEC